MQPQTVTSKSYAGLFLVTLATLMFEVMLTRVFSVTLWYHYAFMAISVAMFGMTMGALIVYLRPSTFTPERAKLQMTQFSAAFGLAIIACFLLYLQVPLTEETSRAVNQALMTLAFAVVTVPFIFSGVVVTLALTRFEKQVSKLYAADLAGAALGCFGILVALKFTDIYTAIIGCGWLCFVAALYFAQDAGATLKLRQALVGLTVLVGAFCVINTGLARKQEGLIALRYVKGWDQAQRAEPIYEKWTSYSRISMTPYPEREEKDFYPVGWGLSHTINKPDWPIRQIEMVIDATAGTVITEFTDNDTEKLGYLKYDITNLAHHVRPDSDVLVVGVGGGRDILSALVFDQPSVTGVEINSAILKALRNVPFFADFTGHFYRHPKVTLVNDEARAYIASTDTTYDILQVSLIDTWAATAAGAFVLSENSLYTREAWALFMERLSDDGILTFSRWWSERTPYESLRIVSLAATALKDRGVENPRDHILMAKIDFPREDAPDYAGGTSTILVSPTPFTPEAIQRFHDACDQYGFDVILTPDEAAEIEGVRPEDAGALVRLASGRDLEAFTRNFPANIAPPTDNSPFFFNMLRPRDMFRFSQAGIYDQMQFNYYAVAVLGYLAVTVLILTMVCILLPLVLTTKRGQLKGALPFFFYFIGIGLGFMLIEISLMQRFIIFLGHPTYSLAVVLFTVLLASGAGAYLTDNVTTANLRQQGLLRIGALVALALVMGFVFDPAARALEGQPILVRVLAAAGMLAPLGLLMGMCFPIGMKLASIRHAHLTPWLWGLNGAASVTASVMTVLISLAYNIPAAYWTGFVAYGMVLAAFAYLSKRELSSGG